MSARGTEPAARLTFGSPPAADAVSWIGDRLGAHLWSRQREIVEAVAEHRRVACRPVTASGSR